VGQSYDYKKVALFSPVFIEKNQLKKSSSHEGLRRQV
jgi:hypothetical protein